MQTGPKQEQDPTGKHYMYSTINQVHCVNLAGLLLTPVACVTAMKTTYALM